MTGSVPLKGQRAPAAAPHGKHLGEFNIGTHTGAYK